jgi:hypothetical protein
MLRWITKIMNLKNAKPSYNLKQREYNNVKRNDGLS